MKKQFGKWRSLMENRDGREYIRKREINNTKGVSKRHRK